MWHTLYNTETGELIGHTSVEPKGDLSGVTVISTNERKDQTCAWDAETLTWVPRPVSKSRTLEDLFARFTEAEQIAYYSLDPTDPAAIAIDAAIRRNRDLAAGRVSLDSPVLGAMFDRLVALGVIPAERKNEILT